MEEPFLFITEVSAVDKVLWSVIRVLCVFSFAASLCSAVEQFLDWKLARATRKGSSIITRLLFLINVSLCVAALPNVAGSNVEPPNYDQSLQPSWGAWGNQFTCNVQGITGYTSFTMMFPLDVALSLSYFLMIRCEWNEERLRRLEYVVWPLTLLLGIGLGGLALYLRGYNPVGGSCSISYREVCIDLKSDGNCYETKVVRGGDASVPNGDSWMNGMAISSLAIMVVHLVVTLFVMVQVSRYARNNPSHVSKRIVRKALLYASVIVVVQVPQVVLVVALVANPDSWMVFFFTRLRRLVFPLVSVCNLLVFCWGRKEMRSPMGKALKKLFDWCAAFRKASEEEEVVVRFVVGPDLFASSSKHSASADKKVDESQSATGEETESGTLQDCG